MALHDDRSIEWHTMRFIDCTLPKAAWTHEGHFAAALWLSRFKPDLTTPERFRGLVVAYNEATNTPNTDTSGYHHTITIASLRAAAHHLRVVSPNFALHETLRSLMASSFGRSDWLLAHWQRDTLFSVEARREWVEPDLATLPF